MTKKKEDPQLEPDKVTEETPSAEQTAEQAQGSTEVAASDEQVDEQVQEPSGGANSQEQDVEQTAEQAQEASEDAQTSVLEDIARRTMREHDLDRVYVTSDGTAFYARHDAHNHARNLVDDTIFAIEPTEEENE